MLTLLERLQEVNLNLINILSPILEGIPNELMLRDTSTYQVAGFGLFIAFGLMAITKLLNKNVFNTLLVVNTKVSTIEQYLKEVYNLNSGWSFILLGNYWLSFSLLGYVIAGFLGYDSLITLLLVTIMPIAWVLLSQLNVYLVSLLTGEYDLLKKLIYFRIVGVQLLGVVLFVICTTWILIDSPLRTVLIISLIAVGAEFILRIFKSMSFARQQRISWYYIILYICTLEILPLLVFYYLVDRSFKFN